MRPLPPLPIGSVSRTMDARHLNAVANHPDVRLWLGGEAPADAPLDLTAIVEDPANIAMATPHGGFVAVALGSGRYDVHSLFLVEGRGYEAITAQVEAVAYMFSATDATELRTTVPTSNRPAAAFAKRAGFEVRFTSHVPWVAGARQQADCCGLSIDRWALRSTQTRALGAWFHEVLADAKAASGSARPVHEDDPVHDAMVGAVVLLVLSGNPEKAVRLYNVWAGCAHYAPIALLRLRPVVIDVVDAIVEASPGGMEVLRCR